MRNPQLTQIANRAALLMASVQELQPDLPDGVDLHVRIDIGPHEPGVKLALHAPDANPAAIEWLQEQIPEAETTGPYGSGKHRQVHVAAKIDATLHMTAYQSLPPAKKRGKKKKS